MSGLPAAVRTDAVEADRMQQEIINRNAQRAGLHPDSPVDPQQPVDQPLYDQAPDPLVNNPPPQPHDVSRDPDDGNYKLRFTNLKSVYDDNISAAREEARLERQARLRVEAELHALRSSQSTAVPGNPGSSTVDPNQILSADQREFFTDSGVDAIAKVAQAEAARQTAALREEFANSQTQQHANTQQQLQQRFNSDLLSMVPKYVEINDTDDWKAYLAQTDPDTNAPRQKALEHHAKHFNAAAVAGIFNGFLSMVPASANAASPQAQPGTYPAVLPATPRGSTQQDGFVDVEIWSQREINKFYQDQERYFRSKGKSEQRTQEFADKEARIMQAYKEGRVEP